MANNDKLYPAVYKFLVACNLVDTAAKFLEETGSKTKKAFYLKSTESLILADTKAVASQPQKRKREDELEVKGAVEGETAATADAKRKKVEESSSSDSDSDSSEDSDSDDDDDNKKKVAIKKAVPATPISKKVEESSSSDSDSSEDSDDDDKKKIAVTKKAVKKVEESSSSDSDSSEDSDSDDDIDSSSDDEAAADAKIEAKEAERKRKADESAKAALSWLANASLTTTPGTDSKKKEPRVSGEAFRRVDAEMWNKEIIEGLADNSYENQFGEEGYGAKASKTLVAVRGKDFRHEKTKKKRGSYRGGTIDSEKSNSFKYDSD